ncbi:hypothetical protein T01_8479 [Trichinella spiralis]|uniref:Uncharacterized protein n=1 Tax=Trichinella spiralis TaxID=6334 RepID=A0A0V1AK06_TRISP|nr:hypothetical protein T01_8479 [Trichinella spiralis]
MDWGITGIDDRRISTSIADGLHNTGGMAVINYITHNGDFTGVWRACRYYGVTDGVDWYKDCGWASQHWAGGGCVSGGYSTLIMQWNGGHQLYNS